MSDYTQGVRQDQPSPGRVTLDRQARAVVSTIRAGMIAEHDALPDTVAGLHQEFPDQAAFVRGIRTGIELVLLETIKLCEEVLAW